MAHEKWVSYGKELKRLREQAGLTQRQLASRMKISQGMLGALERATRQPTKDYSDRLDTLLNTGGVLSRLWHDVSGRRDVPEWFRDTLTLERRAVEILDFQSLVIPGLLQSAAYATILDTEGRIRPNPEGTAKVVATRTARLSAILERGETMAEFVVSETVLRKQVGGPEVMREQLAEISESATKDQIILQVLPESSPSISQSFPFRVMRLDRQTVAYAEHADGGVLVDDPRRVERLSTKFRRIQAEALPPGESVRLLRKLGDDLYGHVDHE